MSVRDVTIKCDTEGCRAYCYVIGDLSEARAAAERRGWELGDVMDVCPPCSRGEEPHR